MAKPGLDKNVKFRKLVQTTGLPEPYVRGLLEMMWDVAHESGNPVLGDEDGVEAAAKWPGARGALFNALKGARLIDQLDDGQWVIHDYWDHAPEYVKGRLRKEKWRKEQRVPFALSQDRNGTVPQKSATNTPTPVLSLEERTKESVSVTKADAPGFDAFWSAYPRKTAKKRAAKAWRQLSPDPQLLDRMLAALAAQKAWDQWVRGIIPHPATWLNERRWEDERPPSQVSGRPDPGLVRAEAMRREREANMRRLAEHREEEVVPLSEFRKRLLGQPKGPSDATTLF